MGAVLHARRRRLPPSPDRGRSHPAPGDRLRDAGAERTGEVGDPAGGAAGGGPDDGPRSGRDARPHGADAAGARRRRDEREAGPTAAGRRSVRRRADGAGDRRARPGRRVGGRLLARRRRDPSRCRADPARRRRQPDAAGGHRHPARDGRRHRGARSRAGRRARGPTTASASRWPTSWSARPSCAAIDLGPADVAAAIDEIPILCLAAAMARGTTTIRGAGELRHKESDRIAGIAAGLRALGARVEIDGDDLRIDGGAAPSRGAATDSLDDHRLAMTFAIAGLLAGGPDHVRGPARRRSPIPASSTTSKGSEHDEARRPHRPPGRPFAVRRDAAGRVRRGWHRRALRAAGTVRRSTCPTRSTSCAATTSSAPT